MSASDSMTAWIARLRTGDDYATTRVWRGYYQRLVGFARKRLGPWRRSTCDEEDIAAQALHSFFRRAERGGFPKLQTRDDLWRVLATITKRKVMNQMRYARAQRRASSDASDSTPTETTAGDLLACVGPLPPSTAELYYGETLEQLLGLLDEELQQIALAKLYGYTNVEIAARVRRSVPTIERRLRLIRDKWEQEGKEPM
jgi:DNA-directed RNA polymerase specialized sigma24 family protein